MRGTWNPLRGHNGTGGCAPTRDYGGRLYYIVSRHDKDGGKRRMLGFVNQTVVLDAVWASPGGGKVVWELFPAELWNPNTGLSVAPSGWNPVLGAQGTAGAAPHRFEGRLYYIVNRWMAEDGELRAGRMLGFVDEEPELNATWATPTGNKVPWDLHRAPAPAAMEMERT